MSFSMNIIDKLLSHCCEPVERKYVLICFSFERIVSPYATVTGIVT